MIDSAMPISAQASPAQAGARAAKPARPLARKPRPWLYSVLIHLSFMAFLLATAPVILGQAARFERPLEVVRIERVDRTPLPSLERPALPPNETDAPPLADLEPAPEVVFETEALSDQPLPAEDAPTAAFSEIQIAARLGHLPKRPAGKSTTQALTDAPPTQLPAPQAPVARPAAAVKPGGPTTAARLLRPIEPVYPERQRRSGAVASVVLLLELDAEGRVRDVSAVSTEVHADFVRSAISAARAARFEPARENGRAVSAQVRVVIHYRQL